MPSAEKTSVSNIWIEAAWAMYKGKFQDVSGKGDPSVWKTRLRCALNKSPNFQEVLESNNLRVTEPYKLYRIVSTTQDTKGEGPRERCRRPHIEEPAKGELLRPKEEHPQMTDPGSGGSPDKRVCKLPAVESQHSSKMKRCQENGPFLWTSHPLDYKVPDLSVRGDTAPTFSSDFWLHVRLYYLGQLVTEVTTKTAEGCRIVPWSVTAQDLSSCPPLSLEVVSLPSPQDIPGVLSPHAGLVLQRILRHLDHGVLLWVAPEGVFVKRQCQVRVYWNGPLAPHSSQPNKLQREKTCKVLDTDKFMQELHTYMTQGGPEPRYQIQLCFGEEFPDTSRVKPRKLLTAQVDPVFARELMVNIDKGQRTRLQDTDLPSPSVSPS